MSELVLESRLAICYTSMTNRAKDHAMLAVRLPADLEARLNKIAKESGRSKSWIARDAIMERIADWEAFAIAEKRMADRRAGRTKAISLEELMAEYGLDD
jgi:RHH-type transcriptional regulator, rel operon repressor / antitoxin RelB